MSLVLVFLCFDGYFWVFSCVLALVGIGGFIIVFGLGWFFGEFAEVGGDGRLYGYEWFVF